MVSCLNCLLRTCFDTEARDHPEEVDHTEDDPYGPPPQVNRMLRFFQPPSGAAASAVYSAAESVDPTTRSSTDGEGSDDPNCSSSAAAAPCTARNEAEEDNPHAAGLKHFWKKVRDRFSAMEIGSDSRVTASPSSSSPKPDDDCLKKEERCPMLTQASSFDSSREIPTILSNSIIYPGSDLQKEMAKHMSATLEQHDDECVICMEGFSPDNPRMPTLCGCGENKTYFHLPCLYQWIEQSKNCPSCNKRLRWEEF